MSAKTDHEAFLQPSDPNAVIWRYMDLPRFISMLHTKALYFAKVATLSDQYEGGLPTGFKAKREKTYRELFESGAYPIRVDPSQQSYAETTLARSSVYVNCWCMHECESDALWKLYGEPNGLAVRSTYSRLVNVLPATHFVGRVQYIDYSGTEFPDGNMLYLPMHKRRQFAFENEVRALYWDTEGLGKSYAKWAADPSSLPPGYILPVNLGDLIEAVVISPYAPTWFKDSVDAVISRFEVTAPAVWSEMR